MSQVAAFELKKGMRLVGKVGLLEVTSEVLIHNGHDATFTVRDKNQAEHVLTVDMWTMLTLATVLDEMSQI